MQTCTLEELEEVGFTSRQLNSLSTSIHLFTMVVLCDIDQQQQVSKALLKSEYDSVELAYAYDRKLLLSKSKYIETVPSCIHVCKPCYTQK